MKVKYVLGAEFDLDGARVRDVYPSNNLSLFQSPNTFADLLFPDQMRNRSEDWTVGCLFRTPNGFSYTPQSATAVKHYIYNVIKQAANSSDRPHFYAVAIITPEPFYSVLHPLLADAGHAYAQTPSLAILTELHHAIHMINIKGMPLFTHSEKRILQMNQNPSLFSDYYSPQSTVSRPDVHFFETNAHFMGKVYPLRVPTYVQNHNAGEFSLAGLLRWLLRCKSVQGAHKELTPYGRNTPAILVVWLGLLTRKRVILFAGYQTPAAKLGEYVQAASFLGGAGGLLDTQRSAFPYVDLNRANDLLASGTFLAGVSNPVFINNPEWWDVAVDLEKPFVVISPQISQTVAQAPLLPRDAQFMKEVSDSVAANVPETEIREVVVGYTTDILRSLAGDALAQRAYARAQDSHMFVPGFGYCWSSDSEREQFETRYADVGAAWQQLPSFEYFMTNVALAVWPQQHKPVIDLRYHYDLLRQGNLDLATAAKVYLLLCEHINDIVDITQFLAATNSIYYLVLGVYHPSSDVRDVVAQLILRIQKHSAGQLYFLSLPPFHSIGLHIAVKERQILENGF